MKIAVLTYYTNNIKEYGHLSEKNKRKYARIHGYDFIVSYKSLDDNRAAAWTKILLIKRNLKKYDWIFWTDADSLIMNMKITLESIIKKHEDKSMVLTRGVSSPVNTGEWLVKNSKWSHIFLNQIWNSSPEYFIKNNPWEQGSLVALLNKKIKSNIAIVGHRIMNSIPNIKYLNFESSPRLNVDVAKKIEYRSGDFIVHFMFTKNLKKRVMGMKHYYNNVIT